MDKKLTISEIEYELANNCCNFEEDPQKYISTCVKLARQGMNEPNDDFLASLIDSLANNLKESTITSWTTGDISHWSSYAKRMKECINSSHSILITIRDKFKSNKKGIDDK